MAFDSRVKHVLKMVVRTQVKGKRLVDASVKPTDGTGGFAPSCYCGISEGVDAGKAYINGGTYESCLFKQITVS